MSKRAPQEPALALHLDAGKDRGGKPRQLLVILDCEATIVEVIEGNASSKLKLMNVPVLNPTLDVKPGVYREMLRLKRQGNPKVDQRENGRWLKRKNRLTATIGESVGPLDMILRRRR